MDTAGGVGAATAGWAKRAAASAGGTSLGMGSALGSGAAGVSDMVTSGVLFVSVGASQHWSGRRWYCWIAFVCRQ